MLLKMYIVTGIYLKYSVILKFLDPQNMFGNLDLCFYAVVLNSFTKNVNFLSGSIVDLIIIYFMLI